MASSMRPQSPVTHNTPIDFGEFYMDPRYTHRYTNNNYMCELYSDPVLNTNYIYLNLYSDLVR